MGWRSHLDVQSSVCNWRRMYSRNSNSGRLINTTIIGWSGDQQWLHSYSKRTWGAIDACGNTATASRTVSWKEDRTAPVISGVGQNANLGCNPTEIIFSTPSSSDACGSTTFTSTTGSDVAGDNCSVSRTRTWTARDGCGNTATASQTLTWKADQTAPVISGVGQNANLGCNPTEIIFSTPSSSDACGSTTFTSTTGSDVAGDNCSVSRTRTWTARDGCGNTATASQTLTWKADRTPPVITTGGTTDNLGCNPTTDEINGALGTATASDACGTASVIINPTGGGPLPGSCLKEYKGNNGGGNCPDLGNLPPTGKVTLFFTSAVTVAPTVLSVTDNDPSTDLSDVLFGPGELSNDGLSAQYCYYVGPNNNHNLWGGGVILTFNLQFATGEGCTQGTPTPGGLLIPPSSDGPVISNGCTRTQTRTWGAIDACGNTATASRTVSWKSDQTAPVISGVGQNNNLGCNPTEIIFSTPSSSDACGSTTFTSTTGSDVAGDNCSVSRTRTWTARDGCGNTATASQTLPWKADRTAPVFTSTPASVDLNCTDAVPGIVAPTASDACGTPTVTLTGSTDNPANCTTGFKRIVTRTWTARDACGNTATYTQTIRVRCCETVCTLTQGAYGNPGGNICLNGTTVNQTQIMTDAL